MSDSTAKTLSICIVNWNTRDLLRNCLGSIYADPESENWEVIVVDNGSSDGSVDMVRAAFPRARVIAAGENVGFARANNVAMETAGGSYLLLLNSDTVVEPGALGALTSFMDTRQEAGASGPKLLNEDGSLQASCGIAPSLRTELIRKLLLHRLFPSFTLGHWDHADVRSVGWVTGACILVRREVVDAVGPLDPKIFMFYEDLEWCVRIRAAGWDILYYPHGRVVHLGGRSVRQNLTPMLVTSQQSLFYLFEKHFGRARLQALRCLTLIEMVLRTTIWTVVFALRPTRRTETRERLSAYRTILRRTVADRSYWAPLSSSQPSRPPFP